VGADQPLIFSIHLPEPEKAAQIEFRVRWILLNAETDWTAALSG
jgi:hypothetical protein